MNFFKKNYNKPGPGVPRNAPKKKGFARFFEIFSRDMGDLFKLNLWVELCCLPSQALLLAVLVCLVLQQQILVILFAVLALAASTLVVPAFTAQAFILTKRLRDDPGFVWADFKKTFKENYKSSIAVSILYALVTASQILMVFFTVATEQPVSLPILIIFLFSAVIFGMLLPYFFIQKAYLDLPVFGTIKNSLFLALGNAPKSIVALLIHFFLSGQPLVLLSIFASAVVPELTMLLLPIWFIYVLALGHFLPNLISYMWTWPLVDKTFNIEKTLKERQEDKLKHIESDIAAANSSN